MSVSLGRNSQQSAQQLAAPPPTPNGNNDRANTPSTAKQPNIKVDNSEPDGVQLTEQDFAVFYDASGNPHPIKRFTWKNRNKIEVQVINYGARVIAMKLPGRKGDVEDVLLGFDDLAGYLYYGEYYLGGTIGRVSNIIKNGSFTVDNKTYNVSTNAGHHCYNGGWYGLDSTVWDTYVSGKKVLMTHVSPHLDEGFPGSLFLRVIFELTPKNEFKVSYDAQTTHPTIVDMSQLLYFNLAGHFAGPEEMYKHVLTLNCNCFTPMINQLPTGEILNVMHTPYDFQIPKTLGKVLGVEPKDGFYQNLCVNRAMFQNECFVGRLLHPGSGRLLEIYSNQPGVLLNTANHFGYGIILTLEDIQQKKESRCETASVSEENKRTELMQKVHDKVMNVLKMDETKNYQEIVDLIGKMSNFQVDTINTLKDQGLTLSPLQTDYLTFTHNVLCEETDFDCDDLKQAITALLDVANIGKISPPSQPGLENPEPPTPDKEINVVEPAVMPTSDSSSEQASNKRTQKHFNTIPSYYRSTQQIRGKHRAVYRAHGAIALQTQNYPNAVNLKQFPNAVLRPGEIYKHEITYRFWIRAGNPSKWIRRTQKDIEGRFNN